MKFFERDHHERNWPYVIAELSANHRGSKDEALNTVRIAAEVGADAIKLQHYRPETITVRSDHPDFLVKGGNLWDGRQLADLYEEAMMPWEWTGDLVEVATSLGLDWLSTPFDETAVDFLLDYEIPAFKIASFELVDLPLIRYAAATGKPLVMSTGMATVDEIDRAVGAAREGGAEQMVLLRCNSGYPADPAEMDLSAITDMKRRWNVPIGLSDHTIGNTVAIAAVALGAVMLEKHLIANRELGGPDAAFSSEPDEMRELIAAVRVAGESLGSARFGPSDREKRSIVFRPSLRAVLPIAQGELLTAENVKSVRPSGGLDPDRIADVVGRRAKVSFKPGDPITEFSFDR